MIRMLLIGYSFGIRSEQRLCEEVHLNLATAGSVALASKAQFPTTRHFQKTGTDAFAKVTSFAACLKTLCALVWQLDWSAEKSSPSMRA
jgi:transposase